MKLRLVIPKLNKYIIGFSIALVNISLIWYFGWQAIYSNKGYFRLLNLESELKKSKSELEEVIVAKLDISKKISMFNRSSLDRDILEESVRENFGLVSKNERVIIIKQND